MQNSAHKSLLTKLLVGTAVLGGVMAAAPAFADAPPPPTPAFSWTGIYVGGNVGKVTGESTWNGPAGAGEFGGADNDTIHSRSVTYGGQIGYNYQFSHFFLIGIEGTLHGSHQNSINTYAGGEGAIQPAEIAAHAHAHVGANFVGGEGGISSIGARSHFGGDVSARLGVTLDHVLVYAKSGVAFDHFDYTTTSFDGVDYTGSKGRTGFLIGGGLEFALDHHWSIKGEYNHIAYTTKVVTLTGSDATTLTPGIGETTNTFKAGVNFRF